MRVATTRTSSRSVVSAGSMGRGSPASSVPGCKAKDGGSPSTRIRSSIPASSTCQARWRQPSRGLPPPGSCPTRLRWREYLVLKGGTRSTTWRSSNYRTRWVCHRRRTKPPGSSINWCRVRRRLLRTPIVRHACASPDDASYCLRFDPRRSRAARPACCRARRSISRGRRHMAAITTTLPMRTAGGSVANGLLRGLAFQTDVVKRPRSWRLPYFDAYIRRRRRGPLGSLRVVSSRPGH
jgi:hypothetical protein